VADSVGMPSATTEGLTPVMMNGTPSVDAKVRTPLSEAEGSSGDCGAVMILGVTDTYSATSPSTVRTCGAYPSMSKVTFFESFTPVAMPGFRVISMSANAPGAIGSFGAPSVVQPQLGMARLTLTGASVTLTSRTDIVLGVSDIISPMSSTAGSNRKAGPGFRSAVEADADAGVAAVRSGRWALKASDAGPIVLLVPLSGVAGALAAVVRLGVDVALAWAVAAAAGVSVATGADAVSADSDAGAVPLSL
jgi:hypothetical protein